MTARIGWNMTRPKQRKPTQVAGGPAFFSYLKIDTSTGKGHHVAVGVVSFRRDDLERIRAKGIVLDIGVVGWLRFAPDVTSDLVEATIGRRRVFGRIHAPREVKALF